MTGLAFGSSAVLVVFAGWSVLSALALGWRTDQPGWRGNAARQVARAHLTGPQRDASSLWWVAIELGLLGVGSFFAGVASILTDAVWPGVVAVVFFVAGVAAGVVAFVRSRKSAAAR